MKTRSKTLYAPLITIRKTGPNPAPVDIGWALFNVTAVPENWKGNFTDPNGFSYDIESSTLFTGQRVQSTQKNVMVEYDRVIGPYGGGTVLVEPSWDRSRIFNQALAKMNDKRPGANWSEDIAQAGKTAKAASVVGAARDLADALTKRRKGIEGLVKGAVGFLSAGTLLTNFGLKPLVQNVFDSATVLLDNSLGDGVTIESGSSTEPLDSTGMVTNPNSGTSYANAVQRKVVGVQGCRFKIWLNPDPNKSPTLDDFSTLNPFLLGWNLIPYSFLVDWVYNVSGYLEAMETAFKLACRFHKGYYSELYSCRINERVVQRWNKTGGYFLVEYGVARKRVVHFKRTVLHNWPLPNPPSVNVDLGSKQLGITAALLGNILGRHPKATPNKFKPGGQYF